MTRITSSYVPADYYWRAYPNSQNTYASFLYGCEMLSNDTTRAATLAGAGAKVLRLQGGPYWATTKSNGDVNSSNSGDGAIERIQGMYKWSWTGSGADYAGGIRNENHESAVNSAVGAGIEVISHWVYAGSDGLYPSQAGSDNYLTPTNYIAATRFMANYLGTRVNKYETLNESEQPPSTTAQGMNALNVCANATWAIKDANPNAVVFGPAYLDPNPTNTGASGSPFFGFMKENVGGTSYKFSDLMNSDTNRFLRSLDGFSFHNYRGMPTQASHKPENLWAFARLTTDWIRNNINPNARFWITEVGWPTGGANAVTQAVAAAYVGRYAFMMRCVPGLELVSYYQDKDGDSNNLGLYTSGAVIKTQGTAYWSCLAHLNNTIAAKLFYHANVPCMAVALRQSDGTNRLALWGSYWAQQNTGANDPTDYTGTIQIICQTSATGTLTIETIGASPATTNTSLNNGYTIVNISIGTDIRVLSANTPVTFRGLSAV